MKLGKKVWILDNKNLPHDKEVSMYEAQGYEVLFSTSETLDEDLKTYGQFADALVTQVGFECDANFINQLNNCKIICTFGMGFNHIDLNATKENNIYVCNIPNYCALEVADHTLTLALTLLRKVFSHNKNVKNGHWDPTAVGKVHRFNHVTIGLLGFGQIARMVAERFKVFGFKVIAHDDFVSSDIFESYHVEKVSLDELLYNANLLSLHVPLTKETKNMLTEERLLQLPKGAYVVNTCRGGVINEEALLKLVLDDHIAGAGLDVFEEEPPSANNQLLHLDNVIVSPHAAYYSVEAEEQMQTETAENIIRTINGEKPINIVNGL